MNHHYPTCAAWRTGDPNDCSCPPRPAWIIRACGERWEICRFLDGEWVHFMYATTHPNAVALVQGLRWLSKVGLRAG